MAAQGTITGGANKAAENNWRKPTPLQMQKFGLVPVPDNFEPTEEEQILLDMYDTVKAYERQAARLRDEAARARLAARDAEFKKKLAPEENKSKRKRPAQQSSKREAVPSGVASDDELEDDSDLGDEDEDDDEEKEQEDAEARHERREAKLAALRAEIDKKKQAQEDNEDALIQEHLTTDEVEISGPVLKKKRVERDATQGASLIANLKAATTPPHDFSEKLALSKSGVLFPRSTDGEHEWVPPKKGEVSHPNEGAFLVKLEDFNVTWATNGTGNNTVAIKFHAPSESKRFSINIAGPNHKEFDSVLFHFNPRQREKGGQLVVNDKQDGVWGQAVNIPLSQVPLIFGQPSCTLLIQINGEGFDIFLQSQHSEQAQHCARLEHRKELPAGNTTLYLQFPSTDDYGKPENWTVYQVWWGNRPIMSKPDASGIPGVNSYDSLHPRKLFVGGLTKIHKQADIDIRRAELERAFLKYGGARGAQVIVPIKATYAFVEFETERQADVALKEMGTRYKLHKARRSRHEALQEERAAKEAAKGGGKKREGTEWD